MINETGMASLDHPVSIGALILAGVISTVVLVSLPIFALALGEKTGATTEQLGWLASADLLGSAIASMAGSLWLNRMNWRKMILVASVSIFICNLISTQITSLDIMLVVRFLCGLGAGVIITATFAGLCHTSNPDKSFGWYVTLQLILQSVLLIGFPPLMATWGTDVIFVCFMGFAVLGALLIPWLPSGLGDSVVPKSVKVPRMAKVGLAALGIYFLAPAALWGYFEPIGRTFALDTAVISEILGLSAFAGIAGAFTVVLVDVKIGRMVSISIGVILSLFAVWMMLDGQGYMQFMITTCLFSYAWNYTFPYQMGVLAQYDEGGSMAILSLAVQLLGLAFGPFLASVLLVNEGFSLILLAVVASYLVSYVLFWISNRAAPVR